MPTPGEPHGPGEREPLGGGPLAGASGPRDAAQASVGATAAAGPDQGAQGRRPSDDEHWTRLHLWQLQPVRDLLVLAAVVGLIYVGWLISSVTVPLLLAILLAYLFEPVVRRSTRVGGGRVVSRAGAATAIIVGIVVLIVVPVTLAGAYATVQTAAFARVQAGNVVRVWDTVQAGDSAERIDRMQPGPWKELAQWLARARSAPKGAAGPSGPVAPEGRQTEPGPEAPGGAGGPEPAAPAGSQGGAPVAGGGGDGGGGGGNAAEPGGAAEPGAALGPATDEAPRSGAAAHAEEAVADPIAMMARDLISRLRVWIERNPSLVGQQALQTGSTVWGWAASVLGSLFTAGTTLFLTLFFFFFISTGWSRVTEFLWSLVPEDQRGEAWRLAAQMDAAIAGFVRGRLTICLILMVVVIVGYWSIGVPLALPLGALVGALSLIPYASNVGIPAAMLLMWFNTGPGGEGASIWWIVIAPLVVHGVLQLVDDYVLTPQIQGKSTGLDTPTVLFASIAGGVLGGFYGLLIAIPIGACVRIAVLEVVLPRVRQWVRGQASDPLPIGNKHTPRQGQ